MLRRWYVEDKGETYAYQWEENESVVEWMEAQKQNDGSTVIRNINAVKKDAIISQIKASLEVSFHLFMIYVNILRRFFKECPEVALDAVVGLCQALSPSQRGEIVRTLAQLEFENSSRE